MRELRADLSTISNMWSSLVVPQPLQAAAPYLRKMHAEPFEAYVGRISRLTAGGEVALDAGCGTATWSFALSNFFERTIAIDRSRNRVDAARWLIESSGNRRIDVSYGDVTDLSVHDESVDFIFCYGVVIAGLSLRAVMREFRRVAKPGATIYVCTNGLGWSNYLRDERGKDAESYATAGRRGIYNTFCSTEQRELNNRLSTLLARVSAENETSNRVASAVGVSAEALSVAVARLIGAKDLSEVTLLGDSGPVSADYIASLLDTMLNAAGLVGASVIATGNRITEECGEEYKTLYGSDLLALFSGRRATFSHAATGRGRTPEEARDICDDLGLVDFRYGGEGSLVGYSGEDFAAPSFFLSDFGGKQAVWEFMVRKPS